MSENEHEITHEIIDLTELKPLGQARDEVRYNCPNCESKRGKPDDDGKMYWNTKKLRGWCFKCSTAFLPVDESASKDEVEWKKVTDTYLSNLPMALFEGIEYPREVAFNFPEMETPHLKYLKGRNPFLIPLAPYLGLRAWKGRESAVVTPFFYKERICKFQARFMYRKRGMKYYTSEGPKPLYSPMHVFNNFRLVETDMITICEGTYDAIALAILGFPNPVAVLGDKLTPLQLYDIRNLRPVVKKVYVCLDDRGRCTQIAKVAKKVLPGVQETEIFCEWGADEKSDPEDFLVNSLKIDGQAEQYMTSVNAWMRMMQ